MYFDDMIPAGTTCLRLSRAWQGVEKPLTCEAGGARSNKNAARSPLGDLAATTFERFARWPRLRSPEGACTKREERKGRASGTDTGLVVQAAEGIAVRRFKCQQRSLL